MRKAALILSSIMLLTPHSPSLAQSNWAFEKWAKDTGKPLRICPTSDTDATPENPFFGFNGAGGECHQVGPIRLNGDDWFLQNIRNMNPPKCDYDWKYCRVNTLRICSGKYVADAPYPKGARRPQPGPPAPPNPKAEVAAPTGPFGGLVGPKGCERLWYEPFETQS